MTNSHEAEIRALIDQRVSAVRAKDVEALTGVLAPDAKLFDVLPPLQRAGADVAVKTQEWFASYDGEIGYEVRDLTIDAGDDLAFCRYLYHVSGVLRSGDRIAMWVRSTICFRRIGQDWRIVHEHTSVPFDGETGQARLDLEP